MTTLRPYPVSTLATALGLDPADTAGIALAVGVDRSWVKRYRRWGLTERQADQWAARAGLPVLSVWPRWGQLTGLFAVSAHKQTCPQGHPYDTVDAAGYRRCSTCLRAAAARHRQRKSGKPQVALLITGAPHLYETLRTMSDDARGRRVRIDSLVPDTTADEIRRRADQAGLSISAWVCMTLTTAIRDQQDKQQEDTAA